MPSKRKFEASESRETCELKIKLNNNDNNDDDDDEWPIPRSHFTIKTTIELCSEPDTKLSIELTCEQAAKPTGIPGTRLPIKSEEDEDDNNNENTQIAQSVTKIMPNNIKRK